MDAPDPPKAPDPKETASAQSGANRDTAITQYLLNATNQQGPQGSITYNQDGEYSLVDSLTGKTYKVPKFTQTTSYSPEYQKIFDTTTQTQQNIANIGKDQSARIGEHLSNPVDLSNEAVEGRLMELGRSRLDPEFARRRQEMETDLLNRGITMGSEAYNQAMDGLGRQENDAFNELLLRGRGQSVQEILASRNQPINEITALMSGSQVSQPNFAGAPGVGVAPTDYQGAVAQKHASDMAGWQADVAAQQGMMSGLFGLGSAALGGWGMGGFGNPFKRAA